MVGLRPIRIFAALDFSVIINLDSSKYSRQPWATAIYEINRVACEDGRERRCNRPRYKESETKKGGRGGGVVGAVFAKTFKGDFSKPSVRHIAKYQFEIFKRNIEGNNLK